MNKKQIIIILGSGKTVILSENLEEKIFRKVIDSVKSFIFENMDKTETSVLTFKTSCDNIYVKYKEIACITARTEEFDKDRNVKQIVVIMKTGKTLLFQNKDLENNFTEYQGQIDNYMMSTEYQEKNPFLILESKSETMFINNNWISSITVRDKTQFEDKTPMEVDQ